MNKLILLLTVFPLLLATQCEPDDQPCGKFVEMQIPELIAIENPQQQFSVTDTLWLNATVSRSQQLENTPFDLFEFDETLSYYIEVVKESPFNSNNYIHLTQQAMVVASGEALDNIFILTKAGDTYHSRIGIKLLEPGNYTMKVYNINSHNHYRPDCNFTSFSIATDFDGLNSNTFSFAVE